MTSLLFWGPYLAHKKVIEHRHEKRKQKNFIRWEDLRDDHEDEEKRRSSLSIEERPRATARGPSTWDDGLPSNLKVERKSYDDASMRRPWDESRLTSSTSDFSAQREGQRNGSEMRTQRIVSQESVSSRRSPSVPRKEENVEPETWHTPGGFMAELIERGN